MNAALFVLYWAMQAAAAVIIKFGSTSRSRQARGFIVGNALAASSMWFLMMVYRTMNVNVALGIGVGGAFMCAQIAVALVFRARMSAVQIGGVAAITVGMVLLAVGGGA